MALSIRLRTILAALDATATIFVHAQRVSPQERPAMREIRAVLEKQVEAWNRRDLIGFFCGYWISPGLTFYSGEAKTCGWQATLDRYRKRYQSEGREMGTLDFSELQIEILGPKSAFVRGKWHLKMSTGDVGGLFTLVLRSSPPDGRSSMITRNHRLIESAGVGQEDSASFHHGDTEDTEIQ